MKLIKPSYQFETYIDRGLILSRIEMAGRTCYKSEPKGDAGRFVKMLVKRRHLSVLEHVSISVRFICDRGFSHELVRHRIGSYSQESTRFCDYQGMDIEFIIPPWVNIEEGEYTQQYGHYEGGDHQWFDTMLALEGTYESMRRSGWSPQMARTVLPSSLKTEIVATYNLRQWIEVLAQRTAPDAHPQMRELMIPLGEDLAGLLPEVFGCN